MTALNGFLLAVAWRVANFTEEAANFDSAPSDIVANRYIIGIILDYTLNLLAVYTHTRMKCKHTGPVLLVATALGQLLSVEKSKSLPTFC